MRDLVQTRLALLGLVTFLLGATFFLLELIGEIALDGLGAAIGNLHATHRILNFSGLTVSCGVWLLARRGARSPTQLLMLDATGTLAAVVPYTLMAMFGQSGTSGVFLATLVLMLILQTRALMIPSDLSRTLGISGVAAGLAFGLAVGVWTYLPEQLGDHDLPHLAKSLSMWLAVVVAVSSVASWLLFGLRTQIQEARRLGQYILREKIGEGGMGVVYRADHALLRRDTAVKLLPPSSTSAAAIARFEKEVQLTASLNHPNTVTVLDYGRSPDGVFYYVMEYLDGGDLSALVDAGGPMPAARVVHLMRQIASGLAEAHDIGLIHRDVKPGNILVDGRGMVADVAKLVDFGLVLEEGETSDGSVVGTPLYFSPEAVLDPDHVDGRSDLYALGAVAYFCLTGRHVFQRRSVAEVAADHVRSIPPPPSDHVEHRIPEMLEEVVLRCLEKDPGLRPQTAEELRELLEACDDVGVWSPRDARGWWAEHGDAVRSARGRTGSGEVGETFAVDLAAR